MSTFLKAVFCSLVMAVILLPEEGQAECDIRSFIVSDITSIQNNAQAELAFLLTANEQEYNNAKTDLAHDASWLGPYGLFGDKGTFTEAKERARQIAQSINFNYSSSYTSNYFKQQVSAKALDAYVHCLDHNSPGLSIWLTKQDGDFFYYDAFWIGADTTKPSGKLEGKPTYNGVDVVGAVEDIWVKNQVYHILLKRHGNVEFYFALRVSGQSNAVYAVKDPPPDPIFHQAPVISSHILSTASHGTGESCMGGQDSDCIYTVHNGGYFEKGSHTVSPRSSDISHYGEKYTVDNPDQICVTVIQSTGDCQQTQTVTGRLQAIEKYPVPGQ